MTITRREFLQLTVSLALVSLSGRNPASARAVTRSNDDMKVLSDIAYQLFPHARLSKDVYRQVSEALYGKVNQSVELTAMMDHALEILAGNAHEKWSVLTEREKIQALEAITHTPFFQFALNETLSGVYRHPLTWELLGFEGSSLEFGGYINRGFNDIDWLPD